MHSRTTHTQTTQLGFCTTTKSAGGTGLGGFSELRGRDPVCPSRIALELVEAALPPRLHLPRQKVWWPWPRWEVGTQAARCTQHKEDRQIEGKGANDKHENRPADTFELRRQAKQCTPRRPA